MTAWTKALLIIGLVVVGTVALNVAMWRRMKVALAERSDWTEVDFVAALAEAFSALGIAEPSRATSECIPALDTVGDLAAYLDRRRRELRPEVG